MARPQSAGRTSSSAHCQRKGPPRKSRHPDFNYCGDLWIHLANRLWTCLQTLCRHDASCLAARAFGREVRGTRSCASEWPGTQCTRAALGAWRPNACGTVEYMRPRPVRSHWNAPFSWDTQGQPQTEPKWGLPPNGRGTTCCDQTQKVRKHSVNRPEGSIHTVRHAPRAAQVHRVPNPCHQIND